MEPDYVNELVTSLVTKSEVGTNGLDIELNRFIYDDLLKSTNNPDDQIIGFIHIADSIFEQFRRNGPMNGAARRMTYLTHLAVGSTKSYDLNKLRKISGILEELKEYVKDERFLEYVVSQDAELVNDLIENPPLDYEDKLKQERCYGLWQKVRAFRSKFVQSINLPMVPRSFDTKRYEALTFFGTNLIFDKKDKTFYSIEDDNIHRIDPLNLLAHLENVDNLFEHHKYNKLGSLDPMKGEKEDDVLLSKFLKDYWASTPF